MDESIKKLTLDFGKENVSCSSSSENGNFEDQIVANMGIPSIVTPNETRLLYSRIEENTKSGISQKNTKSRKNLPKAILSI